MLPTYVMGVVVLPLLAPCETGSPAAGCNDPPQFTLLPTDPDAPQASCDSQAPTAFGVRLLELNPFGAHLSSGACLFNWREDTAEMYGYAPLNKAAPSTDPGTVADEHSEYDTSSIGSDSLHGADFPPVFLRWLTK